MSSFKGAIPKPVIVEDTEVPVMSYGEPGLLECEIDEVCYRIDSGRQGTALAPAHRDKAQERPQHSTL